MKKLIPTPAEWKSFQESTGIKMDRALKTVWMVDLKKAAERAECLWSKNQKKGT